MPGRMHDTRQNQSKCISCASDTAISYPPAGSVLFSAEMVEDDHASADMIVPRRAEQIRTGSLGYQAAGELSCVYLEDFCDLRAIIIRNGGAKLHHAFLVWLETQGNLP